MKQLLLVRHALPHEGHPTRAGDPPLHPDGRRHAQRLARALAALPVDRIVTSPQQRAIDTGAPLARRLGIAPERHDGLAEIDRHFGRYRSAETIRAEEPERWPEFVASPARFFGLDPARFRATVVETVESLLADPNGRCIAVFSHGMTIKTLLAAAMGIADSGFTRFTVGHASVTRVSGLSVPTLRIESLNEQLCRPAPA